MSQQIPEISDDFLAQLKQDLVCRRVGRGMARLENLHSLFASFHPEQKNAALFAGYLAQWVDIGFQRPALVKEIVARFSKSERSRLPLQNYVYLRLAEGMIAMSEEATEVAIRHLDFVLGLDEQTDDKELLAIANFWKGRCLRMKGEYDQALAYATKGRQVATELGHAPMAAVMRVLESWLLFQKGDAKRALQILQEAEAVLSKTDDYLTLGNIHSSYGRIARRHGRYQHAIAHFTAAIAQYRQRDPCHRNVARTLSNLASVKRLISSRCNCAAKLMLTRPGAARLRLADDRGQRMARLRSAIDSSNFAARQRPNSTKRREFTSSIGITTAWAVSI